MSEYEPKTLGERITRLRKLRNWTQEELARRVGLHAAHLSRIEKDRMRPKPANIARFAEVFGISIEELAPAEAEPLELQDETMLRAFHQAQKLDPEDRRMILRMIGALLIKKRVERAVQLEED